MTNQTPNTPAPPLTATIALSQIQFQPWSPGNYSTANFTLVQQVPGVKLDGESITVTVAPDQTVNLVFQLADPAYVLIGIAFNPGEPGASLGRQEFPFVAIKRAANNSQMTVTDLSKVMFYGVDFNYVILIQQIGSDAIGVIDPDIINEPED